MSKSIYDEAIETLLNMGTEFISVPCNPIGEENSDMIHLRDVTETYELNIQEVVKALEQALKQEKLLKQYKKVADAIVRISIKYPLYVIRESEGKMVEQSFNRIKELENE